MTPLYVLAKEGNLGTLEVMDQETLDWIKSESSQFAGESKLNLALSAHDLEMIVAHFPKREWFLKGEHYDSIHGFGHISRVVFYSYLVSKLYRKVVRKEYLVAAQVHDLRRENDNKDEGHGNRAASWILDNWGELGETTSGISADGREVIVSMLKYHESDYALIPPDVDSKYGEYIDVLKTADALDRFRQPKEKWWPNPTYFRLDKAKELLGFCRMVTLESEQKILDGLTPVQAISSVISECFRHDQLQP